MTITQPATLITDYLLAAFTAALAWRLLKQFRTTGVRSQYWWAAAFAASAVASFTGGTFHGFSAVLSQSITHALWIVALESLVVAAYCVIRAALPAMRTAVSLTIAAGYGAYGVWLALNPQFMFAIAAYACALAILAVVSLQTWTSNAPASRLFAGGIAISLVAAAIQQGHLSPHEYFNHNDLYHVVQAAGLWVLYLGGRGSRR
jgi:hypothetical protein